MPRAKPKTKSTPTAKKRARKRGRPAIDIDPDMVRRLASIGAKTVEIAAVLDVSHDVLDRRFKAEMERGREEGKVSLRRKQIEVALSGNVAMLIFLGKTMLGQRESIDVTTGGEPIGWAALAKRALEKSPA